MTFLRRPRGLVQTLALAAALAFPLLMIAVSAADARAGRGGSFGSRGSRTFSAPPITRTAPNAAQPFNRTITRPGSPARAPAAGGGMFNRPGMGMLGGLAAGFLGAGLFGMLFGNGLFGGLGSLSSFLGLLLQIGLVVLLVRFAMSWWQRRNGTAAAYAGPPAGPSPAEQPQANARTGFGFGVGANAPPLEITPDDYDAFERLLGDVQKAWSDEDMAGLEKLTTPEMASYFAQDIAANKESGVINKVGDVKLLQGDLAEAWREGDTDYATVAMRFSMVDKTTERNGGRVVDGGDQPVEATEVWTFARQRGASGDATWELAAIQQA
ncbi:MAG: TIM44-like domain-containing protein [Xanthobacteraceae bacterium]|nr:TIM44-like domain-containing protein [Xanthobacteraceae bacterium]